MGDRQVWYKTSDSEWLIGISRAFNESTQDFNVETNEGKIVVIKSADVCEVDSSHLVDLHDLCEMNNLHEAPLVDLLRRRWVRDDNPQIYTLAGNVLISVNPYREIAGLYSEPKRFLDKVAFKMTDTSVEITKQSPHVPHVYFIANNALRRLLSVDNSIDEMDHSLNQSIVISGESGAGKVCSHQILNVQDNSEV